MKDRPRYVFNPRWSHDQFDNIEDIMKPRYTYRGSDPTVPNFEKMMLSGDMVDSLYDYDRGFFLLSCSIRPIKNSAVVRVSISTVDDGVVGGELAPMPLKGAIKVFDRITKEFSKINKLPSIYKMNDLVHHYGLHLNYEG